MEAKAKEKALTICQEMGTSTMFAKDCNNGYTLPLRVAKILAHIVADECFKEAYKQGTEISLIRQDYWKEVKTEIDKL